MKRVYIVIFLLMGLIFWAGAILGQHVLTSKDEPKRESLEKRFQLREEMHRRMLDKILHGIGRDDDLFGDMESLMDEMMSESFSGLGSIRSEGLMSSQFGMEWSEDVKGRILTISPKSGSQDLDINVSKGFITIKGKTERKTPHGISSSNFSNTFNVPSDCDDTQVKTEQKEGKIVLHFPFKSSQPPKNSRPLDQRTPLPPQEGDVQI